MNKTINQPSRNYRKKCLKNFKSPIKEFFTKKKYYPLWTKHRRFIYNDHTVRNPWEINQSNYKFDERSILLLHINYIDRNIKPIDNNLIMFYSRCSRFIGINKKFAKIIFDYKFDPPFQSYHREVKRWNKGKEERIEKKFKRENRQFRNMKFLDLLEGVCKSLSNEFL
ncbi:unnamed protein product [Blepharisma stoltei]|uniref:Uncharacterized protein n=1 Tax=Blepharisma stoltei TaxID=1481888 RepID=A0AAU9JG41_9CILI|nr:unnamed protein product [Blepharisma stoltei]